MPHCLIEYSTNLSSQVKPSTLVTSVFQAALDSKLFTEDAIKVRAIAYEDYKIDSTKQGFVCVTAKILSGRTAAQKSDLSNRIFNAIKELALESITYTVEIADMDEECYGKSTN